MRTGVLVAVAACGHPDAAPPAPAPAVATTAHADAGVADAAAACSTDRRELAPGLTLERWPIDAVPAAGTPCLDVVRADPARYRLRAFSEPAGHTATDWRDRERLVAVTNAGMFHEGGAPVGLVVDRGTVRGTDNPKFGGVLAWDPAAPADAAVISAGRDCTGYDTLRTRYRSLVQSYRLIDCAGHAIAWKDPKQYSSAAIGTDRAGRIVFLHARGAVTMAELSKTLAAHDLAGAIFLEGGPEATLVAGDLVLIGSYETGFVDNDDNHDQWALPNVIGLAPR